MYQVSTHERRLIVVRVATLDGLDEAQAMTKEVGAAIVAAGVAVVASADFRRSSLFTPEVTDAIVRLLKSDNPRIERSAHLVGDGATFALQVERMVREANNPRRRVFRDSHLCEAWLAEVLTETQRAWLADWYGKGVKK